MTEIFVYSRAFAEGWHPPDVPHLVISIITPAASQARLRSNAHTKEILRLEFDDRLKPPGILFDETMAARIVDTVMRHQPVEHLVVHCEAGISRSAGVAAALARGMFGHDDAPYFERYVPNLLVYRLVRQSCARAGLRPPQRDHLEALSKIASGPAPELVEAILPADYLALIARYGYATFGDRIRLREPVRDGDLYVWARTDEGYAIAWRAIGPAESWGIVVVLDGMETEHPMHTATSFLLGWLDGSVHVPGLRR